MSEKQDPELLDNDAGSVGSEHFYDGQAVESNPYQPTLFDLPDDFEIEEGDDE